MEILSDLDIIIEAIKEELNKESHTYGKRIFLEVNVRIRNIRFVEVECTPYGECEDGREILPKAELDFLCILESVSITKYTSVDCHSVDLYDKNGDYIDSLDIKEIKF